MPNQEIIKKLQTLKPTLYIKYNITSLELFGSCARNSMKDGSDIDILVEFSETPDLFTFLKLEEELQNELSSQVDLVPKRKLKPELKEIIEREAIFI
jgi:predicted nucleotidyltransferase